MPIVYKSVPSDENAVVHWRTKGSKNGVRVWQNEDGSYTEAGKNYKPGGRYSQADGYSSATDKTSTANPEPTKSSGSTPKQTSTNTKPSATATRRTSNVAREKEGRSLVDINQSEKVLGERLTGSALAEANKICDVVRTKDGSSTTRKKGGLSGDEEAIGRSKMAEYFSSDSRYDALAKTYNENNKIYDKNEDMYTQTHVGYVGRDLIAIEYTDWNKLYEENKVSDNLIDTMQSKIEADYKYDGSKSKSASERNLYYSTLVTKYGLTADPDGWSPNTYQESGILTKEYQSYLDSYFSTKNLQSYIATCAFNNCSSDDLPYSAWIESERGIRVPNKKYQT